MGLELPVWGAPTIIWIVATLGLVGASVLDRFLDDSGADDASGANGDDDPFGGSMGGDAGMGGDGMGGGLDDFDGMDEWDDGFDDGGAGGADTDELEKRLDDLENEVASLSSTVSTVRSENEEISAAVDDIEEDVRNLLDIYEMVTRGINPFVDDSSGFDSVAGGGEGSFGLFEDEADTSDDDLDDDVANADADGFFDDDLLDSDLDDDGFEDDEFADGADVDGFDEELDDDHMDDGDPTDAASESEVADDDMNDDGKSFSELKEEYDSGEADWADDGTDADASADDPFDDDLGDETDPFDDDLGDETDPFDDDLGTDGIDLPTDDAADERFDSNGSSPPESDTAADTHAARSQPAGGDPAEATGDGFEYVGSDDLSGSREKPYLTTLPGDYVGDLLVMEWLEFLVTESDVTDAVRAINYYERIEWVSSSAASRLRDFLSGFGTIDRNVVDRPGTDRLVRDHHTRSLRYITQLNGTSGHLLLLDRWDDLAGGSLVAGGPISDKRRDRRGGREQQNGHTHNGGTTRPMNDPNPPADHADPADGGWGDGR